MVFSGVPIPEEWLGPVLGISDVLPVMGVSLVVMLAVRAYRRFAR